MFDQAYNALPHGASATMMSLEGFGHKGNFRFMQPMAPELGLCPKDSSGSAAEEAVCSRIEARTRSRYSSTLVRETLRQVLRHYGTDRHFAHSLDLYFIIGIARDCWRASESDEIQFHCEEFRNLAYAIMGSLIEVAQDRVSVIRT